MTHDPFETEEAMLTLVDVNTHISRRVHDAAGVRVRLPVGWVTSSLMIVLSVVPIGCGREPASSVPTPASPSTHDDGSSYESRTAGPVIQLSKSDRVGHQRMLDVLAENAHWDADNNFYCGRVKSLRFRAQLAGFTIPRDRWLIGIRLAKAELDLGNETKSLEEMGKVKEIFDQVEREVPPNLAQEMYFRYGLIYLRHAETQNCCLLHNKDSCLLPIRGGGVHTRQEPSRMATKMFERALETVPPNTERYYQAMWLLNVAYMTLGEYPAGVPGKYLIPGKKFLSSEKFPRFRNIADRLGLDEMSNCGSVVADDFNNDGYLDLMVSTWFLRDQLKLYISTADGAFVDRTEEAGLTGICGGLNMVQGDYNNDGWLDVYLLRGAWLGKEGLHPDSLLRNNGDGTFTDVTFAAGLAEAHYPSQTASWADYDLDGDIDLYVGGEHSRNIPAPCRLFRNNGEGTFTDVAESAGVTNNGYTKGVIWGDYNNDRYPDIYVSNLGGANRLYRNNGDGTFVDVAPQVGAAGIINSFPTWFWDYDNDGILDLFVATFEAEMQQVAQYYLGGEPEKGLPRVLKGTPEGKFVDMTRKLGLLEPTLPMGSNFGDLDNDGYLDMYLGTGRPEYEALVPNKMYHNRGGRRFSDVSEAGGFSNLQKGHGVAFVDLDMDGDQDIFMQMGGAYPVDVYVDALYENPGFGNNWLAVELVGRESNSYGMGSRIRAEIEVDGQTRSVYRWVNSGGSFGCNSLRQHFGLAKAQRVKRLEVFWPKTARTQVFHDVSVNRVIRITENDPNHLDVTPRPFKFARE